MFGMDNRLKLQDRVVLITGAANGIGRALALQVKAKGAIPVCVDLASNALEILRTELGDERALVVACSVVDREGMQRVVDDAVARFGGLDVVVANAGIERVDPLWIMPPKEFEGVVDVNVLGVYRTIQPALPHVMRRNGHVVAVSSVSAFVPWPLCAAYGASKAFVGSLMRSLRAELAETGATAGAMYFGYIDTSMMQRSTAKSVVSELFARTPSIIISKSPRTPEYAAARIIDNIENRSGVGFSHFGVKLAMILRGMIELFDDSLSRDLRIPELIKKHYSAARLRNDANDPSTTLVAAHPGITSSPISLVNTQDTIDAHVLSSDHR